MNQKLLKELHAEYREKYDMILKKYGSKDGFVIKDKVWWDYYKHAIDMLLQKIHQKTFTIDDASLFYKEFGFGPKLYGNTFAEHGLERLQMLFLFLADTSIPADQKIREIMEEPENEHTIRGIGINFITLFLTSYFPEKYVQWNAQTDGALKILGVYPQKVRGEKKSAFYLKVNQVCVDIKELLHEPLLPVIDNFLYCLNKEYIGKQIGKEIEKETEKQEKEANTPDAQEENSVHTEMMYYLIKIGQCKGYDVCVAVNDRNKTCKGESFANITFQEMPNFTQRSTLGIAKYIDVIWFKKNTSQPARFFEIEHSTSIFSGLLRLNDVKIDYPIHKATIVIPKERKNLFDIQIERRTFKHSELYDVCDYLTYDDLKKWYDAVRIGVQFD